MNLFWVGIGGAAGSLVRYGFSQLLPFSGHGFPIATLLVNLSGCLLIGLLASLLPAGTWRLLLVTGFLGGFTTYSGFGWEAQTLFSNGSYVNALLYLSITVIGGVLFTWLGWKAAQFMNVA